MKEILEYEGLYEVRIDGSIFGLERRVPVVNNGTFVMKKCASRKLKLSMNSCGYSIVALCKNGIKETLLVHKLVAKHFIDNPLSLLQINHKNGIKTDNRVENLEWCTASQNMIHAYKLGLR